MQNKKGTTEEEFLRMQPISMQPRLLKVKNFPEKEKKRKERALRHALVVLEAIDLGYILIKQAMIAS